MDTSLPEYGSLDGGIRCSSKRDTELRAIRFCKKLCGHGTPMSISVSRLDAIFLKFSVSGLSIWKILRPLLNAPLIC